MIHVEKNMCEMKTKWQNALKGIFMLAIFLVLLSSYMYWNRPPILQFLVAQANFKSDILQNSVPTQHEA